MKAFIKNKPLWAYVVLAYAITWLVQLPGLLALQGNYQFTEGFLIVLTLSSFGPSVAAVVVTAVIDGKPGVKTLLKRMVQWRVSFLVYLIVFYLFPLILFLGYWAIGVQPAPGENLSELFLTVVVFAPLNALISQVLLGIGPLGEELGWRGFMLPHLLQRHGDFASSLILGVIWAFWHLPVFLFPEWRGNVPLLVALSLYPLSTIATAYSMTKLHHWSHGSVFIAILYHGIVNYAVGYMQEPDLWQVDQFSSLQQYLLIIGLFILNALVFGILSKSGFGKFRLRRVEKQAAPQE